MQIPSWLNIALQDLHITEKPGENNNLKILEYFKENGHPNILSDNVAWCAAFVGATLERAGYKSPKSLRARSYLKYGKVIKVAKFGSIAIFKRGKDPAFGHVGFVVEETPKYLYILGGNQNDQVNITPYSKSKLLGLRWPEKQTKETIVEKSDARDSNFEIALKHILEHEGGWSDNPNDPGGPTYKGITLRTYAKAIGAILDSDNYQQLTEDLKNLPLKSVSKIYKELYWDSSGSSSLPFPLALMHFDSAVNQGVKKAIKFLQQSVGVTVDGEFGPITKRAANRINLITALEKYTALRRRHYQSLTHFKTFGKGWFKRVSATLNTAKQYHKSKVYQSTSCQKENNHMSEQQKWWGESLTIWGAIVTALSTVLPVIGPFFGLDITAQMIEQFGQNIAQLIQIIGGLTGTSMTVVGRVRADSTISQRQFNLKL